MTDASISITVKEVAALAGVSVATVSRVLNNHSSVSPATEARVRLAMDRLGYTRNEVARSLKVRQTRTIGIIAPEFTNAFFMEVVETMDRMLSPEGYTMVLCCSNDSVDEERRKLRVLVERSVDALVAIPASDEGRHFSDILPSGMPLVLLDRHLPQLAVDTVQTDNRGGVGALVSALANDGYTKIAFLGGDLHIPTANERYEGFTQAMRRFDLEIDKRFVFLEGAMTQQHGREFMASALAFPDHPDAFLVANDSLHLGATTHVLKSMDLQQRSRLVFASFDYLPYAPLLSLCRYAAAQPMQEIGQAVAALLLRRVRGDFSDFPVHLVLPPELKMV